jgi:hypothetical protein
VPRQRLPAWTQGTGPMVVRQGQDPQAPCLPEPTAQEVGGGVGAIPIQHALHAPLGALQIPLQEALARLDVLELPAEPWKPGEVGLPLLELLGPRPAPSGVPTAVAFDPGDPVGSRKVVGVVADGALVDRDRPIPLAAPFQSAAALQAVIGAGCQKQPGQERGPHARGVQRLERGRKKCAPFDPPIGGDYPPAPSLMRASALLLVGSLCACAPAATRPQDVLAAYARAIAAGRHDEAYRLMSDDFRRQVTLSEFRRAMRDNPQEVHETVDALSRASDEATITARLRYGMGDELAMVIEAGAWRIDSPVLDFYSQRTPRDALRSFVRALEYRRFDVILKFVPSEYRRTMTIEQIRSMFEGDQRAKTLTLLQTLRAHLDDPIEVTGDRATMQYAEGFSVLFVREDGVWRIEDPE